MPFNYSKYECPFVHIEKDCDHELKGPEGCAETYGVWCQCGFRGPVFVTDPEYLKLKKMNQEVIKDKIYFIYKEGVYGHGVFGISTDLERIKKDCDDYANRDKDGWHSWNVYELSEQDDFIFDADHTSVYTAYHEEKPAETKDDE